MNMAWTPAAMFLTFHSSLLILTALTLHAGVTGAFYKLEPHTKKISSRYFEIELGTHFWHWALCVLGAVYVGGAQIMCILQLAPMLACTYYHYKADARRSVMMNCAFILALVGCGVMSPAPTVHSMPALTPAFWGLAVMGLLCLMVTCAFLSGKTDFVYKPQPPAVKEAMNREAELLMGSCLLGSSVAILSSLIMGGAKSMCLFFFPAAVTFVSLGHWASAGDRKNCMQCLLYAAVVFCLGLLS